MSLQWAEALGVFQQAADWIGLESRKSLWGQFWSAHQRFFKYLCVAAKVHRLVELAQEELAQDKVSWAGLSPQKEAGTDLCGEQGCLGAEASHWCQVNVPGDVGLLGSGSLRSTGERGRSNRPAPGFQLQGWLWGQGCQACSHTPTSAVCGHRAAVHR